MNDEHKETLQKIKAARSQLDGIIRMTEEGRCYIDILSQISVSMTLLKKVNQHVLSEHLHSCVLIAIEGRDAEKKISGIETVIVALLR